MPQPPISAASEAHQFKMLNPIGVLSLALGLAAAHTMVSTAWSARAETQAVIDAVTLARPHLPSNMGNLQPAPSKPNK